MPDKTLCLVRVWRNEIGPGPERELHRLALRVDDCRHTDACELSDQACVAAVVDASRKASGEYADIGSSHHVEQLVAKERELGVGHRGPRLVDLGLLAGGRVDHGG